jgi:hypothetical protein
MSNPPLNSVPAASGQVLRPGITISSSSQISSAAAAPISFNRQASQGPYGTRLFHVQNASISTVDLCCIPFTFQQHLCSHHRRISTFQPYLPEAVQGC